jgi:dethiobiotin synthetase
LRGCFVTGTDTAVGKTALSAAIVAAMRAQGLRVAAVKPVLTGLDEPAAQWPPDDALLAAAAGVPRELVARMCFGPPVSPHLAAELAGVRIDPQALVDAIRQAGESADAVVVEGAGGLLVPLADDYTIRDLASDAGLPVVVAARPGVGTINHSLLTVEAARAAALDVRAVVLGPWPEDPSPVHLSNRATIARLGEVPVVTLRRVVPEAADLARAGAGLPWETWIGRS